MTVREVLGKLSDMMRDASDADEKEVLGVAYNCVCHIVEASGLGDEEEIK